jgi:hypothetical protein
MKFELWSLFRDKITYKIIEDDFVYKMSFSSKPKIIGVATEGNSVSGDHYLCGNYGFLSKFGLLCYICVKSVCGKIL